VHSALDEDGADRDMTTVARCLLSPVAGLLTARDGGVICGGPSRWRRFGLMDPDVSIRIDAEDGATVRAGAGVCFFPDAPGDCSRPSARRSTSAALSGIARSRASMCTLWPGTSAKIVDTRRRRRDGAP